MKRNPIGYIDGFGIFYKYDNPTTKDFLEAYLGGKVIPLYIKEDLEDSWNESLETTGDPSIRFDTFEEYFNKTYIDEKA